MFKKASDLQSYQQRVGSHATKPSPTGRIDDLPAWAREPEEYYRSLRDQLRALLGELAQIEEKLSPLTFALRRTMARPEYERVKEKHKALGQKKAVIEQSLHDLRPLARAASLNAFGAVYFLVADRVLDVETKIKIENEVKQLLERPIQEFAKGMSEMSQDKREHRNKQRKMSRHHQRLVATKITTDYDIRWERDAQGVYRKIVKKPGERGAL